MANKYLELEGVNAPVNETKVPAVAPSSGRNRYLDTEVPLPAPEPEAPKDDRQYKPTFFGNLTDRLASGFTLGLTDKISEFINPQSKTEAEKFKKDHPYLSTGAEIVGGVGPGVASGLAVGKAIPALGKATVPSIMGNAAVTGGALSPIEDIIKGRTDPGGMALRAGTSAAAGGIGAGILSGGLRALPEFKFRASGSDLTGADKAAMKHLAATGDRAGIPLRIPELAAERAPGRAAAVEGLDNYAGRMKSGGIEKSNFDAARLPNLQSAVDVVKGVVGNRPSTGLPAQQGADAALKRAESLVRESARPDYDAAMDIVLPRRQDIPNIIKTRKGVYKDDVVGPVINNADPNSVRVLQHTADALEGQIKNNKGGPAREAMLIDQKRGLLNELEAASPEFARAQATTAAGKNMVDELKAGPLGTIASTNKPATQARALLDAEPSVGKNAVDRLKVIDADLPRGILAGEINALSKDPISFGRKLAPTADSESVVKQIVGDKDFDAIKDIITASRARTKAPKADGGENSDGPVGGLWDTFQNLSSGGVIKRMNDPKNIDKLGEQGALQRLLNAFGLSMEDAAIDNLLREPLVVDVKPKRKTNVRSANAQ